MWVTWELASRNRVRQRSGLSWTQVNSDCLVLMHSSYYTTVAYALGHVRLCALSYMEPFRPTLSVYGVGATVICPQQTGTAGLMQGAHRRRLPGAATKLLVPADKLVERILHAPSTQA